jgi:hypothetical protein
MSLRRVLPLLLFAVFLPLPSAAEDLRDLLSGFLLRGLTLAPPADPTVCAQVPVPPTCHVAHFTSVLSQIAAINQFNLDLQSQLSTFPLPSSSGGFTYRYDPAGGTFIRAAESFGPIYAERAVTIGKGFFNLGISYSHFSYDRIDALDLESSDDRLLFLHAAPSSTNPATSNNPLNPWFRGDVITGTFSVKVDSDITAFVATYGLTDRLDIGVAVPLVNVSLRETSVLAVERLSTHDDQPDLHRFAESDPDCSGTVDVENCHRSGSATGLGDVLVRGKFRLTSSPLGGVALATDIRLPTGREEDLLGTGVAQVRGYVVASAQLGTFSPHVNAGYTWAIHRCLGQSDVGPAAGVDSPREQCRENHAGLSDEINYTGGFDWALGSRVTFAADVIGRTFRNSSAVSVQPTSFCVNTDEHFAPPATTPCSSDPRLVAEERNRLAVTSSNLNTLIGAAGFKINPVGRLLITVNGLFAITKKGLQDKFTPMIGLDYAF